MPSRENVKTIQLFDDLKISFKNTSNVWKVRQNNKLDAQTDFIYSINSFAELQMVFQQKSNFSDDLKVYAEHRWRNFKRHDAWLSLILDLWPEAKMAENVRDRGKDFSVRISNTLLDFDLKVTRYPNSAESGLSDYLLAKWLYLNQSTQNRFHLKNRVFVIANPEASIYEYALAQKVVKETGQILPDKLIKVDLPNGASVPKALILRV